MLMTRATATQTLDSYPLMPLVRPRWHPPLATVLVADDDPAVVRFVRRVLEQEGFEVLDAADGRQAVEMAQQYAGGIDLLMADQQMPALSGMTAAEQVRAGRAGIKVLYLTGFVGELFLDRKLLEPNAAFLEKPCSAEGLLQAVRLLLYGRIQ